MKGLLILVGAIVVILALHSFIFPTPNPELAGVENEDFSAHAVKPVGSLRKKSAEAGPVRKTSLRKDESAETQPVEPSETQQATPLATPQAAPVTPQQVQPSDPRKDLETMTGLEKLMEAIDFQYPNGLMVQSIALSRRALAIKLMTAEPVGKDYKFFIHVYKKGDAKGVIAHSYDSYPSTPVSAMKPGKTYTTIVYFDKDLPASGGEVKFGLFDEKDPGYAKLKSTAGQESFSESFASAVADPAFNKSEKPVGFQFENGLAIESVSVLRGMMRITLTAAKAIKKDYKFFVHIYRKGDFAGVIAMSYDSYPATPTSQMKPGESYPTVVQFAEELPAAGGEIKFGLFDEKDPKYAKLKSEKGELQVTEAYEPLPLSPELKSQERLVNFQYKNGLAVKSMGMTRRMMAITLTAKTAIDKDYKFFVHIHKKDDKIGVIAKSYDSYPTTPTSQMQPGKLYTTIIQFSEDLPAVGGEVRYGMFDEKDPQYAKLTGAEGLGDITANIEPRGALGIPVGVR